MYYAAVFHRDPRTLRGLGGNGWTKTQPQPEPGMDTLVKTLAWETMQAEPLSGMK